MSNRIAIRILSIVVLFVSLACAMTGAQPTATPTLDLPATQKAQAALTETQQAADQATQAAQAAQGTADAQSTLDAQGTADAQSTADEAAIIATSTAEYVAQVTGTAGAVGTQRAEKTEKAKAASATAVASATARASSMFDLVNSLKDQGIIDTTEGKYFQLPDFDESWAQTRYYYPYPTGYTLTNFVLRTDAAWESASATAEWDLSGCGFLFHVIDSNNHMAVFFTMDGKAKFSHFLNGYYGGNGSGFYQTMKTPADGAELVLVVQDNNLNFLVNGEHVVKNKQAPRELSSGDLYYAILSGTNKDYGTHCTMTDVELWELP